MIPEPIPILKGKNAEAFIKNDNKPITKSEKAFLAESLKIFKQHPAK
jgi:hypothetical protein